MKHSITAGILAIVLLFLSSCSAVNTTEEPANGSENTNESTQPSVAQTLSSAELEAVKERIGSELNRIGFHDEERYKSYQAFTIESLNIEDYLKYFYQDPARAYYHSPQMALQVQEGLLVNEVHDLLGNPHFNAININMGDAYSGLYYAYTMYVLTDGSVLLIRYMPILPEEYEELNCFERIPNFENIYQRYSDYHYCSWMQVNKVEVLSEQELLSKSFQNDDLKVDYNP